MLRIHLNIQTISTTATQSSRTQVEMSEKVLSSIAGVDERIARVEEVLQDQFHRLQANQFIQVKSAYGTNFQLQRRTSSFPIPPRQTGLGIGIRVTPSVRTCRAGCPCSCHSQRCSSTPAVLNNLLGRLFVGYAGLPALSPKCNKEDCQGSRSSNVSLEYWFPTSFLSKIVRMQLAYHQNVGPSLHLDTLRRIPDNSQCITFALDGNIDGLKLLFNRGLASPRDISATRGYSLLRWALYGKQYETCKFLLQAGVDADYKPVNNFDNSPRIKACHFLLEGNLPDVGVEALRAITNGSEHLNDFIDDSQFTRTHRIVLGLSGRGLEEELLVHPEEIDRQDSMGRTSLAWAAARGDSRSIVTLLRYGANPNILDVQLSGPLSNAAAQGHTACVQLLLDAGADPDPSLSHGIKKGGPLNVAARNAEDPLLIKILLDFGADVNQAGVDGKTALFHAAQNDNASLAIVLLEYGAGLNMASLTGETPLTIAIAYNSHDVLRLFLERWHEYSVCPRLKGPNLLQITALYADVETINILANTEHFRLRYDKDYMTCDLGQTLRQRPDVTGKLTFAFDELLDIFSSSLSLSRTDESLLESGFAPCLSSPIDENANWEHESDGDSDSHFYDAVGYIST